jgi:glycosyltransferase involved in cell wall biosynthesis
LKVLQVCKKSPTPQKDGESIAIHQITKALVSQSCSVDVLAMLTTKHPNYDKSSELVGVNYQYVPVSTSIHFSEAFWSIFGHIPYIVKRFKSGLFEKTLIKKLTSNTYDFVIFEGIFLGLYEDTVRGYSNAKLVLRAHNIEHQIWKRQAKLELNYFKKAFLNLVMNRQFEYFELQMILLFDGIIPISPIDNRYFIENKVAKTLIVPVCIDKTEEPQVVNQFLVGFLGGMDWAPNVSGVVWFVENVWLKFVRKYPDAQFHLAGRNFPLDIKAWNYPGLVIHGEIDDAAAFIRNQSLIISPIFSGSGMRVKIIEAMSFSKCVLSTRIGAEGIAYTEKHDLLIANTAEEYIEALASLYGNQDELMLIGKNAANLVDSLYNSKQHAEQMHLFLQSL